MHHESQIYTLINISYLTDTKKGTCKLVTPKSTLNIIWSIQQYPMERPGIPGSPFSVEVYYTIFDKDSHGLTKSNYNSLTGNFIYQINSGTLPKYSELGIPFGTYTSIATSNDTKCNKKIMIILTEFASKLIIS